MQSRPKSFAVAVPERVGQPASRQRQTSKPAGETLFQYLSIIFIDF